MDHSYHTPQDYGAEADGDGERLPGEGRWGLDYPDEWPSPHAKLTELQQAYGWSDLDLLHFMIFSAYNLGFIKKIIDDMVMNEMLSRREDIGKDH